MTKKSSPPRDNWFSAWCGLVVGVCIILPALFRSEEEGWTGPNIFFMGAGVVLTIVWAAKLVSLGRANSRRPHQEQDDRSGSE
ncbi:hypothetical protein ACFUCV_12495 [Specibacter sp. NPDC057265]|uniref:hypothetical protein n=1 Tax=Specibacter sp. NPDC057265 TaxID=3346075 RepID=UPI003628D795